MCATIAKLYYNRKYIVKKRGLNQSEIFIGEKQYDSTTDSGLFTPSDTIRKVLNAARHSFRANASSLVVSTALPFKLVKKMIHATTKKPQKVSYRFLKGKCHLELYVQWNPREVNTLEVNSCIKSTHGGPDLFSSLFK